MSISIASAVAGSIAARPFKRPSKRIAVNENWDSFGLSGRPRSFFIPVESPDELTRLEDQGELTRNSKPYSWIKKNRGLDIGSTSFQFTLHASNGTVDLVGAELRVQRLIGEIPGIAVVPPPIGGPLHFRHISVNLDATTLEHRNLYDEVTVRDLENPNAGVTQLAASIPTGETENFHVEAFAVNQSVAWWLILTLRVNGKAKAATVIRENGHPFVTLGRNDPNIAKRYQFEHGNWIARD